MALRKVVMLSDGPLCKITQLPETNRSSKLIDVASGNLSIHKCDFVTSPFLYKHAVSQISVASESHICPHKLSQGGEITEQELYISMFYRSKRGYTRTGQLGVLLQCHIHHWISYSFCCSSGCCNTSQMLQNEIRNWQQVGGLLLLLSLSTL